MLVYAENENKDSVNNKILSNILFIFVINGRGKYNFFLHFFITFTTYNFNS